MKKECKIHMLPAEDVADIIIRTKEVSQGIAHYREHYGEAWEAMGDYYAHLYVTDDSKIEEGDWVINIIDGDMMHIVEGEEGDLSDWRKIIATTDESLGLPMVHQDFIKQYCENPCESVMVEYEERCIDDKCNGSGKCGPCIITKLILKLKDNCIIISPIEEKMYSKEEVIEKGKGLLDKLEIEEDDVQEYFDEWIKENL